MTFIGLRMAIFLMISLPASIIGLVAAYHKLRTYLAKRRLLEDEISDRFAKQFNKKELDRALDGYVIPHCSPVDPSNREGEEFLADTRESIFDYMDRNIELDTRTYHLILADTGMGKTMFCLNYYVHATRKFSNNNFCLVSLAGQNLERVLAGVKNKSDTILIADALDEDPKALGRGKDRLAEVIEASADFKSVIITCRSQFFMSEDAIPRETPLTILVPRKLNQSPVHALVRSYVSPFSKKEIRNYINKHFPLTMPWRLAARKRALQLVATIPELAYRPMLLERLPELAKDSIRSTEIYDLYDMLVDGWIVRESSWIKEGELRKASTELALYMYSRLSHDNGRHSPKEIQEVAAATVGSKIDWSKLTSRSLLNRDSRGSFKFSHKSIMEFLVVKSACLGDNRAMDYKWTQFMKELFISWGFSEAGKVNAKYAQKIIKEDGSRRNIVPLFDMYATSPIRGVPDFAKICERRVTSMGDRIAPPAWRSHSVTIRSGSAGEFDIIDAEYNLVWKYIPNMINNERDSPLKLMHVLNIVQNSKDYRLPSYEQLVAFLEALSKKGKNIIPKGTKILIGDAPASRQYLVVQVGGDVQQFPALKLIDKKRKIAGTPIYLHSYITGLFTSHTYATDISVDQLYLIDDQI